MNHAVKVKSKRSFFVAGLFILIFFVLWEMLVYINKTPVYLLPAPSRIFKTLFENPAMYLEASMVTLGEAIVGLVIGVIAGILLASILVLLPGLEDGVMTLAIFIKSTPLVAIAPLLTLWLGFGVLPKIIITALLTFFPVLVNIISGMQRVDPALMDLFRSWNSTRIEIFKFLRVPTAVPYLFTALKITAPLSLIGAVVAEWTGASGGLGRVMWLAYTNLNLPFLFGAIFILATAGMLIFRFISWLETKIVFWQATNFNT